jgi:membrane associated rhomboid family serine protease
MPPIPPLTLKLLWAVVAVIVLSLLLPDAVLSQLVLWPLGADDAAGTPAFMPWQVATHVLVNPGVGGVLFIGLTLFFFGSDLERLWGGKRYGQFLLVTLLVGGLVQLLVLSLFVFLRWTPVHPVGGASAVMYGVLFASAYLDPHRRVFLVIPPVPMKMWIMVAAFTALELLFGVFGSINGIAHVGFLGGMLGAWLHIRWWRGQPPFRRKPPAKPNLRIVH